MKNSKERILRFLELVLDHGADAATREPWDLRAMISQGIERGFFPSRPRHNAKRFRRIRHGKFVERGGREYAALLVVLANSDFFDASYENIQTGEARTFAKDEGEGVRTEAHVIIDLEPTRRGTAQVYSAVIEESPGLPMGAIAERLDTLFRRTGSRIGRNRAGEEVKWTPNVTLQALACASLIDEISRGKLQQFDLVREHLESRGVDEHQDLVQKRVTMQIGIVAHPDEAELRTMLNRVRVFAARKNFDQVRIRYTEKDTKKSQQAVLDASEDAAEEAHEPQGASDAIEKLVARTCKVKLREPMNYDHTEVVDEFTNIAIDKLVAERGT